MMASIWLSALLYTQQTVEYDYLYDARLDTRLTAESGFHNEELTPYLDTLNISLGLKKIKEW